MGPANRVIAAKDIATAVGLCLATAYVAMIIWILL